VPEERDERLNELRVALPGVQVLFAFLLVLPFQRRFGELGPGDRAVYFAAFLCAYVLYGEPYGEGAAAAAAVVYAWLWYGLALARSARSGR
jgi:Family of unknown function (DUF6328)